MEKTRTVYICQQCGKESLKWLGKCPNCQAWNSFLEQVVSEAPNHPHPVKSGSKPRELSQLADEVFERFSVPISEFNRVLGGGIVPGSLILIGGEPGIGNQLCCCRLRRSLPKCMAVWFTFPVKKPPIRSNSEPND